MTALKQFAAEAGASNGLLSALGIDWKLLTIQIIAFLIIVLVLGRFVFPQFIKAVDKRQADVEKAARLAAEAEQKAIASQEATQKLLDTAKKEAADIVATAKTEATTIVGESEDRARKHAEQIVASAHEQLQKDFEAARQQLRDDTVELIALATAKVVKHTHKSKADEDLIKQAMKEVQ